MAEDAKREIVALLEGRNYSELADLVARRRGSLRYLNRLLYDPVSLIRWRAVEGMGVVAYRLAGESPEAVRDIIRNQLWSINDESGGIGWSAPECVGEIIYRLPDMFSEFASIVLSSADEKMLRRGVLWAAGRIAQASPGLVREDLPALAAYLDDPDPVVRGYTLRLMGIMGEDPDFEHHPHLLHDQSPVPVYENGQVREITIAQLASGLSHHPGGTPPGTAR